MEIYVCLCGWGRGFITDSDKTITAVKLDVEESEECFS